MPHNSASGTPIAWKKTNTSRGVGAAPTPREVIVFFHAIGVPLAELWGMSETCGAGCCNPREKIKIGTVGPAAPGVELKLAPVGRQYEARVRGPNITPGYWRAPELTAQAFDDEGYYMMGDALTFFDPGDPTQGFTFEGRLSEDFKLSTGTWVRVGPLRQRLLAHFGDLTQDVVIAGHQRDEVTALAFPSLAACRGLCGQGTADRSVAALLADARVRAAFTERLTTFAEANAGSSTAILRMILLEDPPSIDRQETTDKGSVNQKQVLATRGALVEQLYGADGPAILITATPRGSREHA